MEQQLTQENNKSKEASSNVVLTPGKMRVIKRNGKVVSFEEEKMGNSQKKKNHLREKKNIFCYILIVL